MLAGTLSSLTPVIDLGVFDSADACYRLIAVSPPGAGLAAAVTVQPVHLTSFVPGTGGKAGGYTVGVDGFGFGDDPNFIMVGPPGHRHRRCDQELDRHAHRVHHAEHERHHR